MYRANLKCTYTNVSVQALEMYRKEEDGLEEVLSDVVECFVDTVCTWLRTAPDTEAEPEMLTAFFEMCAESPRRVTCRRATCRSELGARSV